MSTWFMDVPLYKANVTKNGSYKLLNQIPFIVLVILTFVHPILFIWGFSGPIFLKCYCEIFYCDMDFTHENSNVLLVEF